MWLKAERESEHHDQTWERFERKFFVPSEKTAFARGLLSHTCLRDSEYPQSRVNSLYFDTPDLDHFQKSDDGSHERKKFRIRWYGGHHNLQSIVPAYLELKSKRGFASKKQRRKALVPSERLNRIRADNTIVSKNVILQTLMEFGYFSQEPLLPVILISYERFRFVEILTGARICFDWKIRSSLISPYIGNTELNLMLEGGVIEIKGPSMQIPGSLRNLGILGIDWTRFSKYASCLETQLVDPGSVGRFWPAGRIELL